MSAERRSGGGVSLCTVLLVVFITLKLCGVVAWPWLHVLAPLWLPAVVALAFIAFCLVMAAVTGQARARIRRPR